MDLWHQSLQLASETRLSWRRTHWRWHGKVWDGYSPDTSQLSRLSSAYCQLTESRKVQSIDIGFDWGYQSTKQAVHGRARVSRDKHTIWAVWRPDIQPSTFWTGLLWNMTADRWLAADGSVGNSDTHTHKHNYPIQRWSAAMWLCNMTMSKRSFSPRQSALHNKMKSSLTSELWPCGRSLMLPWLGGTTFSLWRPAVTTQSA